MPLSVWQGWWQQSPALSTWVETHPQREDLYAALRPLLVERPLQDRTFLDEIDQLQSSLRTTQFCDRESLKDFKAVDSDTSWLIPSASQLLPDIEPFGVEGLTINSLERILQRSNYGLRLVGYPTSALQELLERPGSTSPLAAEVDVDGESPEGLIEVLPEWQNPDGEALLAAALSQEEGQPARDEDGLKVNPIFGRSGVEQGLALLQMICETPAALPPRCCRDARLRSAT